MTVIAMFSNDGEFLGIAKDYYSAVTFLINRGHIYDYLPIFDNEAKEYTTVKGRLGADWREALLWLDDILEFNDLLKEQYSLRVEEVLAYKQEEKNFQKPLTKCQIYDII